ncbi:hypothetical protein PV11_07305 [Exophiala sideris]|uniref:FAD-binding domain-containing protein n=1 Tax=Exophiala sideris TaxID=1016849 RepID=A0A0D1VUB4_9EURO|nr:hypothetical protein PV11_07305 [Exophiala sideris]
MARLKVLINGVGIAGNALAFWLSKLGHDVTIIERFPDLRATGLQIDLRGHGIDVIKRMGLEQAFRSRMAPEQGLQVVDSSDRRWAYFPSNKSGSGMQGFTTDFEIMRGDLCRIMYEPTKNRAKYVFGTSVQSFEEKDDAIEVHYTDGNTDRFDFVVGADGLGSRTRRKMVGSGNSDGFHPISGLYTAYFTMPKPIRNGEEHLATAYLAGQGRAVMVRRASPDALQVYLLLSRESERLKNARRGDLEEEKAAGRVVLLGDAAYCPSATTGMGTTSAIVGAYILAGEIESRCGGNRQLDGKARMQSLTTAFKTYQDKFQPFMDQVQKDVAQTSKGMFPSSAIAVFVVNLLAAVASLCRINIAKYILKEDVKDWELPEYVELRQEEQW